VTDVKKIGLIAGYGHFPIELAENLVTHGFEVHCVAAREETFAEIERVAKTTTWLHIGQIGSMIKALKRQGVHEVVMAGKIRKVNIFRNFRPDMTAIKGLLSMKDKKDDTILLTVASLLEDAGLKLIPQTRYAGDMLARNGHIAGPPPSASTLQDMYFGFRQAKAIAGLDIGQTVVVRDQAVMAVEAIEGTDEAILRGGSLAQQDKAVVVKVAKPAQDLRFDVPAAGPDTLRTMHQAGCHTLCIEAECTLLIEKASFIELANQYQISVYALDKKDLISH